MEKKINWSLIASILFGIVLSLLGWIVQQNERRLTSLENWREKHENYSRDQMILIQSTLSEIKTNVASLLKAEETRTRQ